MPDFRSKTRTLLEHLEPLGVSGLALLGILLGGAVWTYGFHLHGESYEWAIYLTLGTLFPAILLLLSSPPLSARFASLSLSRINFGLALLCVIVSTFFIIRQRQYTAFALAIVNLALIAGLRKRAGLENHPATILVSFFVLVLAWTVAARLLWWNSFGKWFVSGSSWVEDVYRFFICAVSLLLVSINLHWPITSKSSERSLIGRVAEVVAVLIIGLASVRSDQLFNTMSYSHWSVIVGPAAMVRQGEWLFWDVPSQYGFLNILAVALLPVKSIWQSSYIINSFLLFCSAVFLFFVLRLARPSLLNFPFALTVTLAAVFLIAGWPPALLGPQVFPSLGPFRFIWCYALLFVLLLEFRTSDKRKRGLLLFVGCLLWLIGTLWSSESAVYAAAIWIPAYAILIVGKPDELAAPSNSRWRAGLLWALVPPILLAISVAFLAGGYFVRLGRAPDWRAFYEYSIAFASGFFAIPIDVNGPVWVLFLIFCAFSTATVFFLRHGLRHRAAALIIGTWGALWSISSYFVSRSHPNNATVLTPLFCVVIGVTIYLLATYRENDWWASLVRLSFVPVLTAILTITLGNASFLGLYLSSPKLRYDANIDSHLPGIDPSLLDLFKIAQVRTDDPIVYSAVRIRAIEPLADGLSHDHGVLLPAWRLDDGHVVSTYRTWLPTTPFVLFAPLPTERKQEYMSRFISRTRLSGWLIQSRREASYTTSPWFYDQIIRTHTPTKMFENSDWQLIWFEFKSQEQ